MYVRRRATRFRPRARVKRVTRYRRRRARIPRQLTVGTSRNVHKFVRSIKTSYSFGNNSGTQYKQYALAFNLADIPNASEFTTLYDQYMITGVQVKLVPRANVSLSNTGERMGTLISVLDYDDNNPLASIDEFMQRTSKKITRDTQVHVRYLRPMVSSMVYQSAVTTAYGPKRMRLDMSNSSVPHYGLKIYWDNPAWPTTDGVKTFDVYLTYYFTCYNVR